ncbi:hypothetical protein ACH5RR_029125 [Cinchona calisaya]|uniref:DUF4283 domain-containing protein n=1 Tax=Cinchona calisaya TaxID=153742 RepID=A0ABD2YU78_9GENT
MWILKWTLDFYVDSETPIAPVWITLDGFPFHLFHKDALFSIGRLIGNLLKIDSFIPEGSCLVKARICMEIDLTKPRLGRAYVGNGEKVSGSILNMKIFLFFVNIFIG